MREVLEKICTIEILPNSYFKLRFWLFVSQWLEILEKKSNSHTSVSMEMLLWIYVNKYKDEKKHFICCILYFKDEADNIKLYHSFKQDLKTKMVIKQDFP